jgi:methionyl aminopeptidase
MTSLSVNDARPASKGQYGYAYALNASPNHVVCHGIPSSADILQDGDIVNSTSRWRNGYIADSSKTYLVGEVSQPARRLVQTAYEAMWKGIQAVRPAPRLATWGMPSSGMPARMVIRSSRNTAATASVVKCTRSRKCCTGVSRERVGAARRMVFTIEPMVNKGRSAIRTEEDGWTVVTRDGQLSAQFEHTVAVTQSGVSVLTLRPGEKPH